MTKVFLYLAGRSIAAGFLILVVIGLRFLFRKLPKSPQLLLWALVALRLAVPVSLESAWSLIPKGEPISAQTVIDAAPAIQNSPAADAAPVISASVPGNQPTVTPEISAASAQSTSENFLSVCTFIWLLGMAAMLTYSLVTYIRLKKQLSVSLRLDGCLYICDSVRSPFVLGLFHPRIYLPSDLGQEARAYVLAHERAHLRHGDAWWKLLGYVLLSVYWFHPLVWAAYWLFCRGLEMACDERAVKGMDAGQKKDYAYALLLCAAPRGSFSACPVAFSQNSVKARITNILQKKNTKVWVGIIAVLLAVVVVWCFSTDPKAALASPTMDMSIDALSALVINESTGQVVYTQNADASVSPGKWAQLALAIGVVREIQDPESTAISVPAYVPAYKNLQGLSVKDHLYRMLLMTSEESAHLLAKCAFGSDAKAVQYLNQLVESICPGEASFKDLNGESDRQYITASGLQKLIAEALKEPLLKEIWESSEYTVPATSEVAFSRNFLLAGNPAVTAFIDPRVTGGIASGSEDLADIAVTAVQDGRHLLCIILGAPRTSHLSGGEGSYAIIDYWGNHEEMRKLLDNVQ